MSYASVKTKARSRFNEVQLNLNHITSLEPTDPRDPVRTEVNIMKGLFYVHLYSALEKTTNEVVESSLLQIASHRIMNNHFIIPFNTISLVDKLRSFKDCGHDKFYSKASDIFSELTGKNIVPINETAFSNNLQNIWANTILDVMRAFGINNFVISAREQATIDEVVDKRNAVAHGRESAAYVGERYRTTVLRDKMTTVSEVSFKILDKFEDYYDKKAYLKPIAKKYYV